MLTQGEGKQGLELMQTGTKILVAAGYGSLSGSSVISGNQK